MTNQFVYVSNVLGANTMFEAAMRAETPRFLHMSADEAYGSIPEPGSFLEGDALEPNSPYSASKASADLLARSYRQTYGYPIIVTRTANNFGPYHLPGEGRSLVRHQPHRRQARAPLRRRPQRPATGRM